MYARDLAFRAQVNVNSPVGDRLCFTLGLAWNVCLRAGRLGADRGVCTPYENTGLLDEEAPVAGCDLRKSGDIVALVLAGLQIVRIVDGGIRRVVGGNSECGDDSILAFNRVLVVGVWERGVAVVAGDRLGDACARRVSCCGCGFVAVELVQSVHASWIFQAPGYVRNRATYASALTRGCGYRVCIRLRLSVGLPAGTESYSWRHLA